MYDGDKSSVFTLVDCSLSGQHVVPAKFADETTVGILLVDRQ
jgi:hypothetical protein